MIKINLFVICQFDQQYEQQQQQKCTRLYNKISTKAFSVSLLFVRSSNNVPKVLSKSLVGVFCSIALRSKEIRIFSFDRYETSMRWQFTGLKFLHIHRLVIADGANSFWICLLHCCCSSRITSIRRGIEGNLEIQFNRFEMWETTKTCIKVPVNGGK